MKIYKTPSLFKWIMPLFLWDKKSEEKIIYLTFDDGPIPIITDFVLSTLSSYSAKATFFFVGENAARYPHIAKNILARGHSYGNHTYNHLVGWNESDETYLSNIEEFEENLKFLNNKTSLFRPPHGKITPSQVLKLRKSKTLVLWDVLTRDYSKDLNEKECLSRAIRNTEAGSIVVFHDSLKAEKNLRYVLPRYLDYFQAKGFSFKALPML